ncbi:MAG: family 2 glycosyl transferase [Eubacterium sp.]|nr:family 2 glycosyl transferase [Eubacterium sp.]
MKRIATFLLVFSLILSLYGCGMNHNPLVGNSAPSDSKEGVDLPDGNGNSFSFFTSSDGYFYHNTGSSGEMYYIKGVNMGLTEATTDLANPNVSYNTYKEWFEQIKAMNANTVRVFSAMNPNFYEALYDYNSTHTDDPLYLIQGIWFSEDLMYELTDALESDQILINAFKRSVTETLDMVHGKSDYTTYGEFSPAIYDKDISEYVVGYILGLEYPADFVIETNASHPDEASYDGTYLCTSENASPFEAFLCEVGETLISYETEHYAHQTPVAFLNWQTLDTIKHTNEPFEEEDSASVNTENILKKDSYVPGLFAAIDVYPYYPEFMNHQKEYLDYRDEDGNFDTYRAYLRDLKAQYSVPVLIAEYGMSTSRGIAHTSVNGLNQGGIAEEEQGNYNAKMTKDIALEGYCGGLLFSWQDEWFKRTWNTTMYYPKNPTDRTHNLSSAEQSYGMLSFDVSKAYPDGDFDEWNEIDSVDKSNIKVQYDADYMHILVDLPKDFDFEKDTYYIPISVLGVGSKKMKSNSLSFNRNCDFVLEVKGKEQTRLLCDAYYDVFNYKYSVLKQVFESNTAFKQNSGTYNKINTIVSNEMYLPDDDVTIPPQAYESGLLKYGNANPESEEYCSQSDFFYKNGKLEIRLAWYLLNVGNARLGMCVDKLTGEEVEFTKFSDIYIGGGMKDEIKLYSTSFKPLKHIKITPRLKQSYPIMQKAFEEVTSYIDNK